MQMDVIVNLQNNASVPLAKFDDAQIYSFAIFIYLFFFFYMYSFASLCMRGFSLTKKMYEISYANL